MSNAGLVGGPTQTLVSHLRRGLADGSLTEAGRLRPERVLARELGVTRARLRRALEELEREGSIFRRRGQGTFPAPPPAVEINPFRRLGSRVTPRDVIEVRLQVEPALAALAAERAGPPEARLLEQLAEATRDPIDTAAYDRADDVFHYKIAEIARNPLFLTLYDSIRAVRAGAAWAHRRHEAYSAATIAELGRQHHALCPTLPPEVEAARQAMARHVLTVSAAMG